MKRVPVLGGLWLVGGWRLVVGLVGVWFARILVVQKRHGGLITVGL